ncbi:MAG: alginate export family protein [Betaproteobacteria bacterium]|nr:alginate export family protein [Betaproteobacteria bacterium]
MANGIIMRRWVPGLIAGSLVMGGVWAAPPAGKPAKKLDAQAEILRRLQELEVQVAQFRAETARLQAELARRDQAGKPPPASAGPVAAAGTKPAASGDWDEPEVEKTAQGRDEEARRRVMALETQVRKFGAETAKQAEETKGKPHWEFSGKLKARVNSRHNFNLGNPLQEWRFDNATFVDHRFQLGIEASHETLSAKLVLDKGNFVFDWKEDSEGTLERWGEFQTVNSALIREMYAQYTGPFMVRMGRQSWDVAGIVLEGPMDSVRAQVPLGKLPWGQTTLGAGYMSVAGGWRSYNNFGAGPAGDRSELLYASNKLDAYYLDLEIRPAKGLQLKPYLLKVRDRGGAGDADLNLDKDFNAATTPRDGRFEPLWAGLSAAAEIGKLKLDAQAVWLSGDITAGRKVSANALVLHVAQDFGRVGSLHNLSAGVQFGRGSGNGTDDPASGTLRNFNALFLCRDRHKFGKIFSEDIRAGYFMWDSNLSNITYLRLDATLEPVKGLRVTPSVTRVWTTRSVFEGRGPVFDWSKGSATSTNLTRDVGWEADLDVSYPLTKNLDGFFSLGYFKPGAVYARPDGSRPRAAFELIFGGEFKF